MADYDDSVLPMPLQTERFLVLEQLLKRLDGLSKHTIIMLTDLSPASALPFFADHFSLFGDGWGFAVTDDEKRSLIKEAIEIHRHKGTPWAIKRVLKLLGYNNCELIERFNANYHDAIFNHDGSRIYSAAGGWTHYYLYIPYLITQAAANRVRQLLKDVAPLRCLLVAIRMQLTYNGTITHNANYRHQGIITWQAN